MKISKNVLAAVFLLHQCQVGSAWHLSNPQNYLQRTCLSVASQDTTNIETTDEEDKSIPYSIARGDGSTGGGGLPMPNADTEDGLTRPKVGAKMPLG
jgi:hypothetical protein